MFTFGFSNIDITRKSEFSNSVHKEVLKWAPAEQIKLVTDNLNDSIQDFGVLQLTNNIIYYVNPASIMQELKDESDIISAEQQHSDLVPSKYEGGLKIWECTYDLLGYLESEVKNNRIDFEGKRVLDLGCGHGILGIYALMKGAIVDFQDYNKSILSAATARNIILNFPNKEWVNKLSLCNFFSGDWGSFLQLIQGLKRKYDIILTSETVYNPENQNKLFSFLKGSVKYSGAIYLAAKTYYFGVGGSLRLFENIISSDGDLSSETCWKNSDGVQREILKIAFKGSANRPDSANANL